MLIIVLIETYLSFKRFVISNINNVNILGMCIFYTIYLIAKDLSI